MSRTVHDNFEYYLYQIQGNWYFAKGIRFEDISSSFFFIPGARRYLMKEPDSSIPECKRRLVKIMIVDRVLRFILFGFIFYKIFMKYNFLGFEDFVMGARNNTIIVKFQ